jgi:hypothetical protein
MQSATLTIASLAGAAATLAAGAAVACSLQTVGELHVDLSRGAPIVDGEINGVAVKIMIDTGSRTSLITAPAARSIGLIPATTPGGYVFGIGGESAAYSTMLKSLRVGTLTATDLPPMMVGGALAAEPDVAMLIGEDFLSQFDVELDLANQVIRLFRADGCSPAQLVYWNKPYSQAALIAGSAMETEVALNGRRSLAEIDTGAVTSLVDAGTAATAGEAAPATPQLGVTGLGPEPRRFWIDDFASFAIGDENVAHAAIEVSPFAKDFEVVDMDTRIGRRLGSAPSMLIGEDFLRAHHIMIDYPNRVMVFSYNGGPIFSTVSQPHP